MSQGPPPSDQSALQSALAALWTHHRDDVVDLIGEIRVFVESGLGAGDATAAAEAAERAAHRLAGSLGTFGLADASGTARQLEELIDADRRAGGGDVAHARELVARLAAEVASFDAGRAPPSMAPPTERVVRVIGLVGLDATVATHISEQAALRQVGTRAFADLLALDDDAVGELDAVVADIDRIHLDTLGPGGWAPTRPPFVALSVGRRLADRVAAARARRPPLPPAPSWSRRRARHRRVVVGADPPHPDGAGGR